MRAASFDTETAELMGISVDRTIALTFAIGSGLGFAVAIILMASLREKLAYADVPKPLEGIGIAFILAGMLSLAFLGFSGML